MEIRTERSPVTEDSLAALYWLKRDHVGDGGMQMTIAIRSFGWLFGAILLAFSFTGSGPPAQARSALSPCGAGALSVSAGFQGATGSTVGSALVTNRGTTACTVTGVPTVSFLANGSPLPVTQISRPAFDPDGLPAAVTVLVPGATARVIIQWRNWCSTVAPQTLSLTLTSGHVVSDPIPIGLPRCGVPGRKSLVSVSGFFPASAAAVTVDDFLTAEQRSPLALAYIYLGPFGRPTFAAFRRANSAISRITIDRIGAPSWSVHRYGNRYSCVGIEESIRRKDGTTARYGGWYMAGGTANNLSILLAGSHIVAGGRLRIPSASACAARIPPFYFTQDINLALVLPAATPLHRGATIRVTVLFAGAPLSPIQLAAGCPAGNPFIEVEDVHHRVVYPASHACMHPRAGHLVQPLAVVTRTLRIPLLGPYLRAAAVVRFPEKGGSFHLFTAMGALHLHLSAPRLARSRTTSCRARQLNEQP